MLDVETSHRLKDNRMTREKVKTQSENGEQMCERCRTNASLLTAAANNDNDHEKFF
jgi:hypothetical protein